jgi:hypothetical protein
LSRKKGLHMRIERELSKLEEFHSDVDPTDVISRLHQIGESVHVLREEVDETVSAQMILVEAHDIIGAANAILKLTEVDKFPQMDELENVYMIRCKTWSCIADAGTIKQKLLSSKLVNSKISELSAQFVELTKTFDYLFSHIQEQVLLDRIDALLRDLQPKIEVSSYLAATSLRSRHWKWLGEKAFKHCGMSFKLTGRNGDVVSVIDNAVSKSAGITVGLGNLKGIEICELLKRWVF